MSLDISLIAKIETTVVDKNITHNLGPMWREAGVYDALYNSAGQTAQSVLPYLEKGLRLMVENPNRFKEFDSPNGWGKYSDALPWITELVADFKEYPNGIIGVWK